MTFVGPDDGEMACGEYGPGRMAEPLAIVAAVERVLAAPTTIPLPTGVGERPATGPLAGKRVLITSGPTHEPIDPVRYLANRSSGKPGFAIAAALVARGAWATLIVGPVIMQILVLRRPLRDGFIDVIVAEAMRRRHRALPGDPGSTGVPHQAAGPVTAHTEHASH